MPEEEESPEMKIYNEYFSQLIEAFTNDQAHHSIVNQLYSRSLISEEKKEAQMSSMQQPKARAISLLIALGVEEKPQLLTELITAMKEVEELRPLAEEMSAQLTQTKQVESDKPQDTEVPTRPESAEQQQEVVFVQLKDKLRHLEEDLQTRDKELEKKQSRITELEEHFTSVLHDRLQGVHVVAEKEFMVEGDRAQPLLWEEHGFRMHIPKDALPTSESRLVSVKAIVAGHFQFPKNTEPVSVVYAISLSKRFYKPVKLELQHCVLLERQGQSRFMSYAVASHDQSSLPYQFHPVAGGAFQPNSFYGTINRNQFSFVTIIRYLRSWFGYQEVPGPVRYNAMTFQETKVFEYHWILAVAKDLNSMKQHFLNSFKLAEHQIDLPFRFQDEGKLILQVEEQTESGWLIQPFTSPCMICRSDVDQRDPEACPVSCRVKITVEQLDNPPSTALSLSIPLEGIISSVQSLKLSFHPPPCRRDSASSPTSDMSPLSLVPFQTQLENPPAQREFTKMVALAIPAKWHTFGVMLGIELSTLDDVKGEHEKPFIEVYRIWKSATPCPFTWKTVVEVLDDMKEKAVVRRIMKHFEKPTT